MTSSERPIDVIRDYLADPDVQLPAKVYSAILLAVELVEAKERAAELADFFGVTTDYLLGRDEAS